MHVESLHAQRVLTAPLHSVGHGSVQRTGDPSLADAELPNRIVVPENDMFRGTADFDFGDTQLFHLEFTTVPKSSNVSKVLAFEDIDEPAGKE